ncbi:hypothetical protein SERLA73DRAFT_186359 [Serpula lacrymans var. lacrymans S7.3]|uniref:Mitochondrial outer membrane transport complex Sam37/metaxin N-terminal domain-containing protein n=2 Tax=Serpula lacrymans var. lacrymans TaxID=341189 RepID=F8Q758_SERL3|nr:uncharacterized protein SERLADRAFT_475353 [Serpula lacrymans var. lacrymans S7.9]EGN95396.1 hypothetical protein SERLA73DRAFT_186359 [Serpula lacrymans var. lacrymans S7.3]EGO20930.1 hypothetical protein SERLADRAFT_475353 [Serpula lacrymans var. lacrymans S7.9]
MSTSLSSAPYTLHIWPGKWNLSSIDPICLAAVLYLQLTIPGKFQIVECVNPDLSSSGYLPFLTHGHVHVSTLSAIISFVTSLSKSSPASGATDIEASLNNSDKAKRTAWFAHVESGVGDLVSHMFYSLDANYRGLTHPTLASMLPIPQRYYVPGRIRDSYKPRLEASELWSLPGIEQEKESPFGEKEKKKDNSKDKYVRVFEQEKVLAKARSCLDLYANLLQGKPFFFGDRIAVLDVYFAAHVLLLLDAPFPDPLISSLLKESYPSLVDHARLVKTETSAHGATHTLETSLSQSLSAVIPRLFSSTQKAEVKSDADDVRFSRMRWAWITLAIGAVIYRLSQTDLIIRFSLDEDTPADSEENVELELEEEEEVEVEEDEEGDESD